MKTIFDFAEDKSCDSQMLMSVIIVSAIDTVESELVKLSDDTGFSVMWTLEDIQIATNGLNAVISPPDALRLAADLRELAFENGAVPMRPYDFRQRA